LKSHGASVVDLFPLAVIFCLFAPKKPAKKVLPVWHLMKKSTLLKLGDKKACEEIVSRTV